MKKIVYSTVIVVLLTQTLFAYTDNELFSANKLAWEEIISEQSNPKDYRLNDSITRKEFMKVVAKVTKDSIDDICEGKFSDVEADWSCKYIEWALRKEFIATNASFRPNANITKAESMKLILKARWLTRIQDSGDWRMDDMMTANKSGIIKYMYEDFDTQASRGWIFEVTAANKGTFTPGLSRPSSPSVNRVLDPMNPNDVP